MSAPESHAIEARGLEARQLYLRPLKVSLVLCVLGELFIFLVWGLWLYPSAEIAPKLLWTVVVCGVAMGCLVGALLDLIIVGRWSGGRAVSATTFLYIAVLGVGCNVLCFSLDIHFNYFGAADSPLLFLGNGLAQASLGGAVAGGVLFTPSGNRLLDRLGL